MAAGLSLGASEARANAKFPEAGQLVVDPTEPDRIVLRTTFGIVLSADAGQSWRWICEGAVGYHDYEPAITVTDRRIVAGLADRVSLSEAGCRWDAAAGAPAALMADMATSPLDPAVTTGFTVEPEPAGTRLWRTEDGGESWSEHGTALPEGFVGLTLDHAPNDPGTLYLTGLAGEPPAGVLLRTTDDGQSWTELPIPGSDDAEAPYIGAMDPSDDATFYVRLTGKPGRLLVTRDAGADWTQIFEGAGFLRGLTLSPDGDVVLVGGEDDGVWRSPVPSPGGSYAFERASDFSPMCLRWTDAGVYACGHVFFNDGAAVALSTDGGETFEPLACMSDIEPLDCPAESETGASCPPEWDHVHESLSRAACAPSEPSEPNPTGGGSSSSDGGAGPASAPEQSSGCRTGGHGHEGGSAWWLLLLLAVLRRANPRGR